MEIHLVADTNLFFECKLLEQLPWKELGYDSVVVLLTKPVLDEIDKHKKAGGRTRKRALEIFGRVRGMLNSSAKEVEIQSSSPKVVLRLMPNVKPDAALNEHLDYTKVDERLIGIASTLRAPASEYCVKLFTDDTGPAAIADSLGVPYLLVDESWRRPPAETTEEKRVKALERDLATYRAQEPKISISVCEPANESNIVEVTRRVATPLTEVEVESVLTNLRLRHPLVVDFTPPPSSSTTARTGEVTTIEYAAPAEDEIANYRDVLYPQWIEKCRKILNGLHEGRDEIEPRIVLRWLMSNKGTRPASQVRIEFEAKGPLALRRLHVDAEDEEDAKAGDASLQLPAPSNGRFPLAPKPPSFRAKIIRIQPPAEQRQTQRDDISTLQDAVLRASGLGGIGSLSKALAGMGYPESISRTMRELNAATDALRSLGQPPIFGAYGLDPLLGSSPLITVPPPIGILDNLGPYLPKARDPECFYYDWPKTQQVKNGALTCELWRHQTGEETFEFEVLFANEGEARGAVECTVHAENLTKPEQARVVVCRTIERLGMIDLANAMVEACQ